MGIKILPAPTGGLNARDPLHAMAENEAIELTNLFPETSSVVPRGGVTIGRDFALDDLACYTLMTLQDATGAGKLFVITNYTGAPPENIIYRVDSPSSIANVTPLTAAVGTDYSYTVSNHRIFAVAAGFTPFDVGTTGTATASTWSGSGLTSSNLSSVASYKKRLFFTEANSANLWYGALLQVTGGSALTKYDASFELIRGGELVACGSTSKGGTSAQELFFAVSNVGEVLVWQGDYPGSDTWSIVGHFNAAPPIGANCIYYTSTGAHIITRKGAVSVTKLLGGAEMTDRDVTETDKISKVFNQAEASAYDNLSEGHYIPEYNMLLINRGLSSGSDSTQFVQNTITKAWCDFDLPARSWAVVYNQAHWGSVTLFFTTGDDRIYILGAPNDGGNVSISGETTAPFQMSCRQAFNYLDDPTINKTLTKAKIFFDLTQETGHDTTTREVQVGIDRDFGNDDDVNNVILGPIASNTTTKYKQTVDVRGSGTALSLILKARFGGGYGFAWNLSMLEYKRGGTWS